MRFSTRFKKEQTLSAIINSLSVYVCEKLCSVLFVGGGSVVFVRLHESKKEVHCKGC